MDSQPGFEFLRSYVFFVQRYLQLGAIKETSPGIAAGAKSLLETSKKSFAGVQVRMIDQMIAGFDQFVPPTDPQVLAPPASDRELFTLKGLTGKILGVMFSPDGKRVYAAATGGFVDGKRLPGEVMTWDIASGAEIVGSKFVVSEHSGPEQRIAFSPNGKWIASARKRQEKVRLLDLSNGREVHVFEHVAHQIAFSFDSSSLATAGQGVKIWDILSGRETETFDAVDVSRAGFFEKAAFCPDGKCLATCNMEPIVKLWNIENGKELQSFTVDTRGKGNACFAFSPDGKRLATAIENLKVWDVATGRELGNWNLSRSDDRTVPQINPTGVHTLCLDLAFSPNGSQLASSEYYSLDGKQHHLIRLHDSQSGKNQLVLTGHISYINCIAFSPDGKTLVSGSDDGAVKLWDLSQRE